MTSRPRAGYTPVVFASHVVKGRESDLDQPGRVAGSYDPRIAAAVGFVARTVVAQWSLREAGTLGLPLGAFRYGKLLSVDARKMYEYLHKAAR
jgi:hypothetical protein